MPAKAAEHERAEVAQLGSGVVSAEGVDDRRGADDLAAVDDGTDRETSWTVKPRYSPPEIVTGPRWMPIRTLSRTPSGQLWCSSRCCAVTAAATASLAFGKT